MPKKVVHTSLKEDFDKLGIPAISLTEQAHLGGIPLTEDKGKLPAEEGKELCPECKSEIKEGKCTKCDYRMKSEDASDDDTGEGEGEGGSTNEGVDPLDSDTVNAEMFEAIMALPFDELQAEDVDELLEALKEKAMPEDASDELKGQAEQVVDFLLEAVAKKTRRSKAGSMAKKASFQCPPGTRKDPKDPGGRRCVRAAKAAGGAGKLAKTARKKGRWSKSGKGKTSGRKSSRWAARRGESVESVQSPFALELAGLMEDTQEQEAKTVRDELLERVGNVMELLSEEFLDEAVTRVFEEAYELVEASWDAGRLDEDVMDEDEFIAEIKPVMTLIHKSLVRIQGEGELGN